MFGFASDVAQSGLWLFESWDIGVQRGSKQLLVFDGGIYRWQPMPLKRID